MFSIRYYIFPIKYLVYKPFKYLYLRLLKSKKNNVEFLSKSIKIQEIYTSESEAEENSEWVVISLQ